MTDELSDAEYDERYESDKTLAYARGQMAANRAATQWRKVYDVLHAHKYLPALPELPRLDDEEWWEGHLPELPFTGADIERLNETLRQLATIAYTASAIYRQHASDLAAAVQARNTDS